MTAEDSISAAVSSEPTNQHPRKRILIEASKLADEKMDGIKRYVEELLHSFSRMGLDQEFDLDIMIHNQVYPLADLATNIASQNTNNSGQEIDDSSLRNVGMLIPPVLLYPIKWLIPGWASRKFLGKEKSELQVPVFDHNLRGILMFLLPPVLVALLQKVIPESFVHFLWTWGILEPPPKAVDPTPYDLIHFTLPNNHHYIRADGTAGLVTVHDLCHTACPQYQTRANSVTLKRGLDRAVESGASFISVSTATQEQLIEQYKLDSELVCTVHNGCSAAHFHPVDDASTYAEVCRKYAIPPGPYLLALSTIEPRKNLAQTIEAFELMASEYSELDISLVIAGNRGWKSGGIMHTAENSDHIHLTGYIADEDLANIYSSARGFVYVSHYEGFGLPLLEAMHCGVPVIYGNNSSMPEIVGDAGIPANSDDVRDIARQMHRLVSDEKFATALGKRALERATEFSWDKAAEQTAEVYRRILA